jgi:glycosyltransferase involved in cell wall biosynthesis
LLNVEVENLGKALVSVIIPAFNAEADIRQALNSVLAQTYQEIEVIVVDDGSSDATSTIVEEFVRRDARFQLVRQTNAGVGAARNTAIRKARGKYIAPLDADDFWSPEKLEKQVACMEQSGNDTGLVYCWSTLTDKSGELVDESSTCTYEGRLRHALVLLNVLGNASVPLFRAAALEKVGLYLTRAEQGGAQGCEDWDLALRVAEVVSIRVVPEYLVTYRQNGSSMSVDAEGMAASYAVIMSRARQRNSDLPSAAFRWSAGYFYLYLADKCYACGRYSDCLGFLEEAVRANPVLLLKAGIYKRSLKAALRTLTGSAVKTKRAAQFHSNKRKRRSSVLNIPFRYFELARWSAALHDGA